MGLYDTIYVKNFPLPLPSEPKGFTGSTNFQTKDLECCLQNYEIREDGTLWCEEFDYVENDLNKFDVKHKKWTFVDITTTFVMCDYFQTYDERPYDYFIDYTVVVIKGVVDKIEIKKFEVIDNSERKESDIKFHKRLKDIQELQKTKRYKYLYMPYTKIVCKICNTLCGAIYYIIKFLNQIIVNIYKFRNKISII